MNPLEALVDHTYVINLAHRADRLENVTKQLGAIGWGKWERFDAYGVNHLPPARYYEGVEGFQMSGWWGNKFSHMGVIEAAKEAGHKAIMVFEDDVEFSPVFDLFVGRAISDLSAFQWDWLHLGGNHRYFGGTVPALSPIDGRPYVFPLDGITQVTGSLARISKMVTAHAYIVKQRVYEFILRNAVKSELSIDGFYGYEVHPRFDCYTVTPCVTRQMPGITDISGQYVDNSWFIGD